jgi:Rod binding domain-containing protein
MTVHPLISNTHSAGATEPSAAEKSAAAATVARQFEGILLQQLIRVLRETAPTMGGSDQDSYVEMFDGQLADYLAESGGIGLASEIQGALSGDATAHTTHRSTDGRSAALQTTPLATDSATTGIVLGGRTLQLQQAADQLLRAGSQQWSKTGALNTGDLQSSFATYDANGNKADFVVRKALGYQGYNKCNLFALELARRAGFSVPVVDRGEGWGFPSSNGVTKDAATDGKLRKGWAKVVENESAEILDSAIVHGQRAFILAGSGRDNAQGHMAVVERIRSIEYAQDRSIRRIVFDGWEARPIAGAEHLVQRTWNVGDNSSGHLVRSGFDRIQILELQPATQGTSAEVPISGDTISKKLSSTIDDHRPNDGSETLP